MTIDADFTEEDAALRKTYLGTDNYTMGARIADYIKEEKPDGGKVCTIEGNPAADNILRRAQGVRDALTGQEGLPALKGEGGWTEVAGCPVFTNDDGAKGVQAMTDILAANPDLDAFAIMGGWPLFGAPQPYRDLFEPLADKIASDEFVIGAADTIGDEVAIAREGLVTALVGQRPFEMGYVAPDVHDQADQRRGGRGPGLHRPRRMHQGHGRHLHPEVAADAATGRRRARAPSVLAVAARPLAGTLTEARASHNFARPWPGRGRDDDRQGRPRHHVDQHRRRRLGHGPRPRSLLAT